MEPIEAIFADVDRRHQEDVRRQVQRAQAEARFLTEVKAEIDVAVLKHRPLNSLHEAYAVILEEVDELWEHVRQKRELRDADAVRRELVQIAAMCWLASVDLRLGEGRHDA